MYPEVISTHFDSSINQFSPVMGDLERIVELDEKGAEKVRFEAVDYPSLVALRGNIDDYSIDAMIKAGININIPIRTGFVSRIEGASVVHDFATEADKIFTDPKAE